MTPPVFHCEVDDVAVGETVVLTGDEGRHAADVRRLRVGEPVDLTAGRGTRLSCVVTGVRRGELTVEVRDRVDLPRPEPHLTVVQALARGGRDEQAIEVMTEIGVDHVIGWEAERNVAHWTGRTRAKWATTAHAAAKQSRRGWWPEISGPASTADVAARCGSADLAVVLHAGAPEPLATIPIPAAGEVVVVIGPEGGITEPELAEFGAAGARVVRLGENVLRSSTAGAAALSVISSRTRWI